eukprot:1266786-Rhodomonas_salina.3
MMLSAASPRKPSALRHARTLAGHFPRLQDCTGRRERERGPLHSLRNEVPHGIGCLVDAEEHVSCAHQGAVDHFALHV